MEALAIKLKDVEIEFDGKTVLDIPELQIYQNDRIGIIGDNGAGMTTLLRLLTGQLTPAPGKGQITRFCELNVFDQLPHHDDLTNHKSGGEVSKQRLTQVLYGDYMPALAFDEPTNHLDRDGINWLISELKYYYGLLIIISHDQFFLDKTINKVIEVKDGTIILYSGNVSDVLQIKAQEKEHIEKDNAEIQKEKQRLESSLKKQQTSLAQARRKTKNNKNIKDTKPDRLSGSKQKDTVEKSANKVMKSLEKRLDSVGDLKKIASQTRITFPKTKTTNLHATYPILGDKFSLIVDDHVLFEPCNFSFKNNQKIAIIGKNGVGKTQFFKAMEARGEGLVISPKVNFSNYLQLMYIDLPDQSIEDYLLSDTEYTTNFVRSVLAQLGFTYKDFTKSLQVLSGGERVRILLARTFLQPSNVIILDEATNFMDFNTLQALKHLIIGYPGMVLFTSHDQQFVNDVADEVFEIKDKHLNQL